jgi:hypothetical protein
MQLEKDDLHLSEGNPAETAPGVALVDASLVQYRPHPALSPDGERDENRVKIERSFA